MDNYLIFNHVLAGALVAGLALIGLFFLRYWRDTRDRLFAWFAASFCIQAVNRFVSEFFNDEHRSWSYWVRLIAFLLIIVAILDKNRKPAKNP